MKQDHPDLFAAAAGAVQESRAARDDGIGRVTHNVGEAWMAGALRHLLAIPYADFTGEDVRKHLLAKGYAKPHHANAWGAVMMTAVKRGLIEKTGEYRPMKDKRSHARATPVYVLASKRRG